MAGKPCLLEPCFLILLSIFVLTTGEIRSQDTPPPPPPPLQVPGNALSKQPDEEDGNRKGDRRGPGSGEIDNLREALKRSPRGEENFKKNLQRWKDMPPEQKNILREHEELRKAKITHEIEEAVKNSGLQLDKDQREVFALRYIQERRKMEEKLQKEMEVKRSVMLKETLDRIKSEFNATSSTTTSTPMH